MSYFTAGGDGSISVILLFIHNLKPKLCSNLHLHEWRRLFPRHSGLWLSWRSAGEGNCRTSDLTTDLTHGFFISSTSVLLNCVSKPLGSELMSKLQNIGIPFNKYKRNIIHYLSLKFRIKPHKVVPINSVKIRRPRFSCPFPCVHDVSSASAVFWFVSKDRSQIMTLELFSQWSLCVRRNDLEAAAVT